MICMSVSLEFAFFDENVCSLLVFFLQSSTKDVKTCFCVFSFLFLFFFFFFFFGWCCVHSTSRSSSTQD